MADCNRLYTQSTSKMVIRYIHTYVVTRYFRYCTITVLCDDVTNDFIHDLSISILT